VLKSQFYLHVRAQKGKICRKRWEEINVDSSVADHGRSDWLGYWVEFVQKSRFKKLACLCHIRQNDLTYLGRVCTPCLSVSIGIYGSVICQCQGFMLYMGIMLVKQKTFA